MDQPFVSLRRKLSLVATAIVFLITWSAGTGFMTYKYWRSSADAGASLRGYQAAVAGLAIGPENPDALKDDPKFSALFARPFLLLDASGAILLDRSPFGEERQSRETVRHAREGRTFEDDGYAFRRFALADGKGLIAIEPLQYGDAQYFTDLGAYSFLLLALSLAIYATMLRFVAYVLKPVRENVEAMRYFVQAAGHELKTPLASVLSSVQLLKETGAYDAEAVSDIEAEARKSGELIGSLSELASMNERAARQEVHLSETVYEALRDLDGSIRKKRIDARVNLEGDATVSANPSYAYMLVSNLLSNAVKYNREGGEIRVRIHAGGLSVRDTGLGIPKAHLPKIFDAFYRVSAHREGSEWLGLGLAIAKRIADLYGWKLRAASEAGVGSEFSVTFP